MIWLSLTCIPMSERRRKREREKEILIDIYIIDAEI